MEEEGGGVIEEGRKGRGADKKDVILLVPLLVFRLSGGKDKSDGMTQTVATTLWHTCPLSFLVFFLW